MFSSVIPLSVISFFYWSPSPPLMLINSPCVIITNNFWRPEIRNVAFSLSSKNLTHFQRKIFYHVSHLPLNYNFIYNFKFVLNYHLLLNASFPLPHSPKHKQFISTLQIMKSTLFWQTGFKSLLLDLPFHDILKIILNHLNLLNSPQY